MHQPFRFHNVHIGSNQSDQPMYCITGILQGRRGIRTQGGRAPVPGVDGRAAQGGTEYHRPPDGIKQGRQPSRTELRQGPNDRRLVWFPGHGDYGDRSAIATV